MQAATTAQTTIQGWKKEAVILAGGLGTRLRDTVPGIPKCLAPVAGTPFLTHVIRRLLSQGIERFIFSLGYQHELIEEFLEERFPTLDIEYSIEDEPLGTGGGIKLACKKLWGQLVLVVNGDTLFDFDIKGMISLHERRSAECTLCLKPMNNIHRYGIVELNNDQSIIAFKEKQFYEAGLINGGIYLLDKVSFLKKELSERFSFEKDYLERYYNSGKFFGLIEEEYFIDIGVPEDYARAQHELKVTPLDLRNVDKDWTLFIDRDGVINYEQQHAYILNRSEFRFYEMAPEAFHRFSGIVGKIIIVSNQRGIGKGLMTEADLADIHQHMQAEVEKAGGRIDSIYYCTSTDIKNPNRKPNPGMAFQAKNDHPSIDFKRSIMVGNKLSDMQFGRNAGMHTVFLRTTNPDTPFPHQDIDLIFPTLGDFAKALQDSHNFKYPPAL